MVTTPPQLSVAVATPVLLGSQTGIVPVPEKDLPVLLPEKIAITQQGGSPLGKVPEFVNAKCLGMR